MKNISFLLVFLILLQSCSVYHSPTSVAAAVAADKKVRIITTDDQKYKFRRLKTENNRLIGITKPESSTAKKLAAMPPEVDGKNLKVDLTDLEIKKVQLRNEVTSNIVNFYGIPTALGLVFSIFYILYIY